MRNTFSVFASLGLLALTASSASGAVIGRLVMGGGIEGVIVSALLIDWTPPGGTTGDFVTTFGTNLQYDGGTVVAGEDGLIADLVSGGPPTTPGFMTFPAIPGLSFDLLALGPGSSNTDCTTTNDNDAPGCSISPGSPFVLTYLNGTTVVSLFASGTVTDGVGGAAPWAGSFTTQITGLPTGEGDPTPANIQFNFLTKKGYSVTSSYSGEFNVVPEPESMLLIGAGLLAIAGIRRSQKKRV
jgi:hypothetical protein